jgi:ArsR family transcriptional regulator
MCPRLLLAQRFDYTRIIKRIINSSGTIMDSTPAVTALAALAHASRLEAFRLLVQAGPAGMSATRIAETLGVPPSSLSFHLKELSHAKLVIGRHEGRFIIYAANFDTMNALLGFLTANCCGGNPCTPVGATLCNPATSSSERP